MECDNTILYSENTAHDLSLEYQTTDRPMDVEMDDDEVDDDDEVEDDDERDDVESDDNEEEQDEEEEEDEGDDIADVGKDDVEVHTTEESGVGIGEDVEIDDSIGEKEAEEKSGGEDGKDLDTCMAPGFTMC
ncbi:hypothetical protein DPMN_047779 [Dreissena polymorpha]|uniref:Uncharacterized protein n=2 Tax=Dreissena polymorpha TaxID=45954 RepID=A0A9D4D8C3_DREPO|nr:hypothetical protein DPMN_047779 [Dreissena polymorpha]